MFGGYIGIMLSELATLKSL